MHSCWAVIPDRRDGSLSAVPMLFISKKGADSYAALFGGTVSSVDIMPGSWVEAENWVTYDPTPVKD